MDEQTTVIEKIRIGELSDYAAAFAASSPPPGTAPMTRIRALSQVKNPCAREDDIGLLVAYRDGRVIGYHGVMPGLLAVDGCISQVHWSTAVFVIEDCRGRGVGRQLIEAFKGLGKDMMVPGVMTTGAQGAYLSSGFGPLGMCSYFQLRVERVDRIASLFNALQTCAVAAGLPIGSPLSRLSGWMLKAQQKVFYRRAAAVLDPGQKAISWRRVDRIARYRIQAPKGRAIFLRGNDIINWMLANPWVYSRLDISPEDLAGEVRHYYFTKTRELFRYAAFEIFSGGTGDCSGFVVLSLSRNRGRAKVKILDHAADTPLAARAVGCLALSAARSILAGRIEIPTRLAPVFHEIPLLRPLLKHQELLCVGFPANPRSPLAASMGAIDLGIQDGDAGFT
jgi:GNAT superfamily N-acetyltransferase